MVLEQVDGSNIWRLQPWPLTEQLALNDGQLQLASYTSHVVQAAVGQATTRWSHHSQLDAS